MFRLVALASLLLLIGLSLMGCCFYTTLRFSYNAGQPLCDRKTYLGKVTLRLVIIRDIYYTPYVRAVIPFGDNIT